MHLHRRHLQLVATATASCTKGRYRQATNIQGTACNLPAAKTILVAERMNESAGNWLEPDIQDQAGLRWPGSPVKDSDVGSGGRTKRNRRPWQRPVYLLLLAPALLPPPTSLLTDDGGRRRHTFNQCNARATMKQATLQANPTAPPPQ